MDNFKWDDDLVNEFMHKYHNKVMREPSALIAEFKASKQPKREWEILSFKDKEHQYCGAWVKQPDGLFRRSGFSTFLESHLIENNCFVIHSVKRLVDGEVFTVGDRFSNDEGYYSEHTIVRFELDKNTMQVIHGNYGEYYELSQLSKAPQPKPLLFKTFDGVDMYAGMYSWYIGDDFKVKATGELIGSDTNYNNLKHFSTREKAEEYILLNKPILCLKDIMSLDLDIIVEINSPDIPDGTPLILVVEEKLKQLAKSKL